MNYCEAGDEKTIVFKELITILHNIHNPDKHFNSVIESEDSCKFQKKTQNYCGLELGLITFADMQPETLSGRGNQRSSAY